MNYNELDLKILKTIISNKKHGIDFCNDYDAKLFSVEVWNFANIVINYIKTYKDVPTLRILTERLGSNDKLKDNISTVWNAVENTESNDKEFRHDLESLKKRFAEKQILNVKDSLSKVDSGSVDITKTISDLQKTVQNIKNLNQVKAYERKTLKESVPIFREEYNAKLNNPEFDRGIKTGYSFIDHATDGLRPGELLLIGGESGGGKSMLLMNMAIQMWLQQNSIDTNESQFGPGNGVLYFSLEMPFKPCLNRVLSRLSGAPSKAIRSASLNPDDAQKLKKVLKFIDKYPNQFEIVDIPRGATIQTMEAIFEEAKNIYNPKIVVIDYLGLMSYDGPDMDDWLKLGKIAESVHEFARVHNCIVLSAVQLNRAKSGKEEDKIGLHRVGRSALILQNANIALQIETRQQESMHSNMIIHLIKNRDGELLKGELIKNLSCGTLLDSGSENMDAYFEPANVDDIFERVNLLED